jgi:hypothetical protein
MINQVTAKQLGIVAIGMVAIFSMMVLPSLQQAMAAPFEKLIRSYTLRPVDASNGSPYGKETIIVDIKKEINDGNSAYDWYFYHIIHETVPGNIAWGSNWRNDYMWSIYQVYQYSSSRQIADYDPSSTTSSSTVSWSITAASSPSFSIGGSYTQNSATTTNCSDLGTSKACWNVDIDSWSTSGSQTWDFKPGFVVRTSQNNWSFVDGQWRIQFMDITQVFNNLATYPWYSYNALDAQYNGDV